MESVLSGIEVTNLTFTEGDTPITTTSSLLIANDDSLVYDKSIDSAKVVIFSGYESTEDIPIYLLPLEILPQTST